MEYEHRKLLEALPEESDVGEAERLRDKAKTLAIAKCEAALLRALHPPEAIVAISDRKYNYVKPFELCVHVPSVQDSTPNGSRLRELVQATMSKTAKNDSRLEALFAKAQMADIGPKRDMSLRWVLDSK